MGDEKGKWLRFEDGLKGSEFLKDKFAKKNKDSYGTFCKNCVDQKLAKERRAILIFLGAGSGIGKKEKKINPNEYFAKKLLIESIMGSCTRSEDGKNEFLTAAVVRCENLDIENVAYKNEKEIEEKENKIQIDSAKENLDKGGRIVENKKRSLWEKYVLIDKDMWEAANSHIKKWLLITLGIFLQYWLIIISALHFVAENLRKKIVEPYGYVLMIFGAIYCVICGCCKMEREKARDAVRKEIRYYRNLDYPVIFYNGTGKTKRWMRNYIQRYTEGETEETPKESVFYIGAGTSKLENVKIHEFIVPNKHSEWGLICLCKLVRDLADNPWGEIWSGTAITDKLKGEPVFSSSLEAEKEENISGSRLQIFKMPKDEKNLRDQIKKKKNWHFARDPSSEDPVSRLFPICDSVYAIRKNISWSDFQNEAFGIQEIILPEIKVFAETINYQFWLIQVDNRERDIIDRLNVISNIPTWDGHHDLWKGMWQNIIQLVKNLENGKITKLCDIVWDEKKDESQTSFVEYRNSLENSQKEEVDKINSDQEEFVMQRTRT